MRCFHLVSFGLLLAIAAAMPLLAQAPLVPAFPSLAFERPTALRHAGNGDGRLYVVEQPGRIRSFLAADAVERAPVFLDITDRVFFAGLSEPGLLGLAFHPRYADNGYFYVVYVTTQGPGPYRTRLSRFTARRDASRPTADPASERILLDLERVDWRHNGGDLHFGPDGYLYVSIGDGDCCFDPTGQGQDRTTLFGTILRLDVDTSSRNTAYGIPPDNPFAGNAEGWREEIWAYGLRNPWRFSFDPETGDLWVGDVGELRWEEVNRIERGGNYGWNTMEGPECFLERSCDRAASVSPIWAYPHTVGLAVTGGYVYRGARAPELYGQYIFADWGTRKLWALRYDPDSGTPAEVTLLNEFTTLFISSFGTDEAGELYALNTFLGTVYRLDTIGPRQGEAHAIAATVRAPVASLQIWPNPATSALRLCASATLDASTAIIYDLLGRPVLTRALSPGSACVDLDLNGLLPGTYLARIGSRSRPFTIAR